MNLASDLEPLTYDVAYWLQGVWDPEYPLEDLGDVCLELGHKLRAVGIITLLTAARVDNFQHNLIRSAACWETFLSRCRSENRTDEHDFCAGRVDALLAALAGHDPARAAKLAALAPVDYRPDHEYEDDYCYARALHHFVGGQVGEAAVPDLLARCAETGDDMSRARAEVVSALLARDQEAFDPCFAALLSRRQGDIQTETESGKPADVVVNAERAIFVEGLALLALAEARGLVLMPDYATCPSLARRPASQPFPGR
jgi:hypothetical protein